MEDRGKHQRIAAAVRLAYEGAFNSAWAQVEREGGCDGQGGAEWVRIWLRWVDALCPVDIVAFIRQEASRGPTAGGA